MTISVFDGSEDAYGWVLCTENYFKKWGTPETERMAVAAMAMKGPALTWWLWWSRRHPHTSWDPFTTASLWRFKPEYRDVLPFSDEEKEPFMFTHSFCFSSPLPGSATINPLPVMSIPPPPPILPISILSPPKPTVADNATITSFNRSSPQPVLTTTKNHPTTITITPPKTSPQMEVPFESRRPVATTSLDQQRLISITGEVKKKPTSVTVLKPTSVTVVKPPSVTVTKSTSVKVTANTDLPPPHLRSVLTIGAQHHPHTIGSFELRDVCVYVFDPGRVLGHRFPPPSLPTHETSTLSVHRDHCILVFDPGGTPCNLASAFGHSFIVLGSTFMASSTTINNLADPPSPENIQFTPPR